MGVEHLFTTGGRKHVHVFSTFKSPSAASPTFVFPSVHMTLSNAEKLLLDARPPRACMRCTRFPSSAVALPLFGGER